MHWLQRDRRASKRRKRALSPKVRRGIAKIISQKPRPIKVVLRHHQRKIWIHSFADAHGQNPHVDKGRPCIEMAQTIEFILEVERFKEILSIPQGSWSLYLQMLGFEKTDKWVNPEGKTPKFVKKDYQTHYETEEKSTNDHKEEDWDNPKQVVGEIRTITRGPIVGGLYKSMRKAVQRQVNNVHVKHPIAKHHRTRNDDIVFSEWDAKGSRQPHDDPFVIMLTIEGCNNRRVLVNNISSADVMYITTFQ